MPEQQLDPGEALALARAARARLAGRDLSPWWYAPLYGLAVGGMVASAAGPSRYAAGVVVFLMAAVVLYKVWARRTGVSVYGYRKGQTRTIALVMVAAVLVTGWASILLRLQGYAWAPLAGGAGAAMIAGVGSRLWDRAWRADIERGV